LLITWGLLVGVGTGSMALVFAATIANRWFVARRGLVMGILTAAGATGQLIFLPILASLTEDISWRSASLVVSFAALAVVPFVLLVLRDYPADRGVRAYGAPADVDEPPRPDAGQHADLHHHLRAGLGGDRAADGRALPGGLRRVGHDRVRLGVRLAPDRRRDRLGGGRDHLGHDGGAYTLAWFGAGALCGVTAAVSLGIRRSPQTLLA
jgi:MFS family permease